MNNPFVQLGFTRPRTSVLGHERSEFSGATPVQRGMERVEVGMNASIKTRWVVVLLALLGPRKRNTSPFKIVELSSLLP